MKNFIIHSIYGPVHRIKKTGERHKSMNKNIFLERSRVFTEANNNKPLPKYIKLILKII